MIAGQNDGTDADFAGDEAQFPAVVARNRDRVERSFWRKLARVAGRIPFAEDAVAAYFCAADTRTPLRVRGTLLAALVYFIVPIDAIPDIIAGLGFTDDASVLAGAIALVAGHIKPRHRDAARKALETELPASPPSEG
jgi:uncharacterized membrane protein YkvA (DUF1232 family)